MSTLFSDIIHKCWKITLKKSHFTTFWRFSTTVSLDIYVPFQILGMCSYVEQVQNRILWHLRAQR